MSMPHTCVCEICRREMGPLFFGMEPRNQIPQWISVKERMPEPNSEVLVITHDGHRRVATFTGNVWIQGSTYTPVKGGHNCLFWMPLPKIPDRESDGEKHDG